MPLLGRLANLWKSDTIVQDVRYGARMLAKHPGFTAAAVLALALGIGANTALLSVVDAVLLRPLPYEHADRLVVILHDGNNPVAPANFTDWRAGARAFERMGAAESWSANLSGLDRPEKIVGLRVTTDIFPLLGVTPLLGRVFRPGEDAAGMDHEIVLGHALWQRRFGGDARIVGRTLTLNGEPYTVVGVMPRGFGFAPFWATRAEAWVPLSFGDRATSRRSSSLRIFARLTPGATIERAQAEMTTIAARIEKEYPGTNRGVTVLSLKEKVVGNVRPALLVLLGAVGFVLLIACANVAHMLLARAAVRQREIAVRAALGASRSRIVRQFLTESLLLALMGGVAGLVLAAWGIRALVALSPANIPRVETIGLDGRVLALTLVVSLVTGIAFGLAPSLQASALDLSGSFKEGGRGSTEGVRRNRLRSALMVSEFALALVLLIGAGLMIRSFAALQAIDPGFDARGVLTTVLSLSGSRSAAPGARALFHQQVVRKVEALPGVQSASAINHIPLAGDNWGTSYRVEGRPAPAPGDAPRAVYRVVLPGYFRTMRLAMLSGRDITERDDLGAPRVVVINERMARRYWPGEDAVGKRITFDDTPTSASWVTVVGVVKDARQSDWIATPDPELYLPYLQDRLYLESPARSAPALTLVVRAACAPSAAGACDAATLTPAVRGAIASIDANVPLSEVQTMEHVVADANARPRFYLLLLGAFAAAALILAAVGIYGVISYSVTRRTHELGIRMALGATRADVLRLVVGQGMGVALVGAGVGLLGALALTRLMAGLLYGVGSTDPVTFVAVPLVLGAVAFAASWIPARRATRIDPLVALRHD